MGIRSPLRGSIPWSAPPECSSLGWFATILKKNYSARFIMYAVSPLCTPCGTWVSSTVVNPSFSYRFVTSSGSVTGPQTDCPVPSTFDLCGTAAIAHSDDGRGSVGSSLSDEAAEWGGGGLATTHSTRPKPRPLPYVFDMNIRCATESARCVRVHVCLGCGVRTPAGASPYQFGRTLCQAGGDAFP